ncbi:MAG: Rieske 2Fe-2S domain-containing protein [Thermodesulfovibrionales bacterium]|nr:Rieske 2Fe-2S domain-containing protein [Thermodesulfovibrionales bacterium]
MAEGNSVELKETGCPHCPDTKEGINRRKFLSFVGWGALIASLSALVAATARFLFPSVIFEPPSTFKIGAISDFSTTEAPDKHGVIFVDEKLKAEHRVWLVREDKRLYAIFAKCTHLGCTPNWFPEDRVFKCPCHGSEYYSNGVNFAGPAPRPMDRYKVSVADDGQIIVDKSVLYTNKDFDNPNSYIKA